MGTFSIEPLEDDNEGFEAEDQNEYYSIETPPEEKPEIEKIKLIRSKGETQWNRMLDESIQDVSLNVLLDEIKVKNGEKSTGKTHDQSSERFAMMPGSMTRVTSDSIVRDGDD